MLIQLVYKGDVSRQSNNISPTWIFPEIRPFVGGSPTTLPVGVRSCDNLGGQNQS